MQKVEMKLVQTRLIAKDTVEMKLEDDYITQVAKPGQFIYLALPHFMLRRPISIADINKESKQLTILFKILGKGTAELAASQPGIGIDVLGPNGNGFPETTEPSTKALLIGGGIGVPPLYYLGKQLRNNGILVTSILGFQTKEHVFYENEFRQLGETIVVTDDGSYGEKGFVTDMLNSVSHFDTYYACGPTGMLRALTELLQEVKGYISLEERMGCGIGACAACVVATEQGYQKICHDGPVFSAKEVIL